jgi:hypothetical protein
VIEADSAGGAACGSAADSGMEQAGKASKQRLRASFHMAIDGFANNNFTKGASTAVY